MQLELLAPARNAAIAIEAIKHGADAVYMGASHFGARSEASNSLTDIASVVDFAHLFNARVYITLNTLLYDSELKIAESLINELYKIGVDALIIQDMGVLCLDIPPIDLHASTQCDIRSAEKALLMQALGFSQMVLARELSADEIRDIHRKVKIRIEAFVHGALCVCYSGCCSAGLIAAGRSGNRGECPQLCRLPYFLLQGNGQRSQKPSHYLSLKDMKRIEYLKDMIDAGVSSFKIEGRLKDAIYVKNVVSAYRAELDKIIQSSQNKYSRSSDGYEKINFIPDLSKSFNRQYSDYFLKNKQENNSLGSHITPKMKGEEVGSVISYDGKKITVDIKKGIVLHNGDGLGFIDKHGEFNGIRLNKIQGSTIHLFRPLAFPLSKGTPIFRNSDKKWKTTLTSSTANRLLNLSLSLFYNANNGLLSIEVSDDYGHQAVVCNNVGPLQTANTSQAEYRKQSFCKLGGTIWQLKDYIDTIPKLFIPASVINTLKRQAIEAIETTRKITRTIYYRKPMHLNDAKNIIKHLSYPINISNEYSASIYKQLQCIDFRYAPEISTDTPYDEIKVMECRYCLRKELGACLKTTNGAILEQPVILDSGQGLRYRLDFDCNKCIMNVIALPNQKVL